MYEAPGLRFSLPLGMKTKIIVTSAEIIDGTMERNLSLPCAEQNKIKAIIDIAHKVINIITPIPIEAAILLNLNNKTYYFHLNDPHNRKLFKLLNIFNYFFIIY